MSSRRASVRSHRAIVRWAAPAVAVLLASACSGNGPDGAGATSGAPVSASTSGVSTAPVEPVEQPPLPADPSGYTTEYVQTTLDALFQDYQEALVAYKTSGELDDTVLAAMANVYDPEVYDEQIRNLEDYFPGGENLKDPPGAVQVEVTDLHSASVDCILAITTYDVSAVTTLDAPAEDDFFIGLARNAADTDGTRPWLITVEYGTSDGEPLPGDVCA